MVYLGRRLNDQFYMYVYICIYDNKLASKTIMISEKAYEILKRRKKPSESFTDVIIRLGSEKGNLAKLLEHVKSENFEPISESTVKHMQETSKKFRKNFKLRNVRL